MFARLAHTKDNRPSSWWDPTRGTLEERTLADCRYQALDREFCRRGTFPVTTICTRDMDWDRYARNVLETMYFEDKWRDLDTAKAKTMLDDILTHSPGF